MAVHKYKRRGDGATVYWAVYVGPDGLRRKHRGLTIHGTAPAREHSRAATAARNLANEQRAAVENGTWVDPNAEKPARKPALTFKRLVDRFLRGYTTRSGRMTYYEQRARIWAQHFGDKPAKAIGVQDVDRFRKARAATSIP